MLKLRNRLKILVSIALAFFISTLASNTVFVAGTPYINKPFLAAVWGSPKGLYNNSVDYISALFRGRDVRDSFQAVAVSDYTATQALQSGKMLTYDGSPKTQEVARPLESDGYAQIAHDVYTKVDVSAGTLRFVFGKDAKFKKELVNRDGQQVTVLTPL